MEQCCDRRGNGHARSEERCGSAEDVLGRTGVVGVREVVLTRRQHDVVRELAADGATNEDIAERLHMSIDTVKTHVRDSLRAAGLNNRTALAVALARRRLTVRVKPPVKAK